MIKKERLWALAKSHAKGYRISDAFIEKLYDLSQNQIKENVKSIVIQAKERAEANNRKTLMVQDI